jgi:1,4-dihydroxy-2-naphthoyl-CoA hydrolase
MRRLKDYYTIKLHDTDAAGILFFANQFKFAHDLYQKFLEEIGFPLQERFASGDFSLPIVHAEADFYAPLTVGDTVEISLRVAAVGETSFTLEYEITDLDGRQVGSAKTVHVTVDPRTRSKIKLPKPFRAQLEEAAGNQD